MHELSVVMGIIEVAESYARGEPIEEITLEIGCLTTIEMNAFEMAWKQGVKMTLLEKAHKDVRRIPGRALCLECGEPFDIAELYDACPLCGGHFIEITQGKELKVKSLIIA